MIVCSEFMRGHLADVFSLDEALVEVIRNGVARPEPVGAAALAPLRLTLAAPDQPLVLMVGRLVYEKGFQLALDALPGLIDRISGLRFVVAGAGIGEAQLKNRPPAWVSISTEASSDGSTTPPARALPDRRRLRGPVDLRAVRSRRARGDGQRLRMRRRRHRRSAGAVPHEEVGLRFATRDPRALAAAVERVLDDEQLRRRLTAAAADHVLGFDWRRTARATAGVYAELRAAAGLTAAAAAGTHRPG